MKYKYHIRVWTRNYDIKQRVFTTSLEAAFAIIRERIKQGFQCDIQLILDQEDVKFENQFNKITNKDIGHAG